MKILFEFTNCNSQMAMYDPIINALRRQYPLYNIQLLPLCEVVGISTDRDKVASLTQDFIQPYVMPFKIQIIGKGLKGKAKNLAAYLRILWMKHKVAEHMNKLLESLQPDIIIFPNDRITPHLSLIKAAKRRGIPTLLVQESIRKDDNYKIAKAVRLKRQLIRLLFGVVEGPLLCHGQGGCDRITAWGLTSREYFKRVGVPKEKVILTGNPRIESIAKKNWQAKGFEFKKRYSIPVDASVIGFMTNPIDGMGLMTSTQLSDSVLMVTDVVASLDNVYLFIKPHHVENVERYKQVISSKDYQKDRIRVEPNVELYPLLSISDACLIFNSTVALESAVLGTPVAVINPFMVDMGIDFVENRLAVEISRGEQLVDFLQKCKDGKYPVAAEVIQKYIALIDGSAEKIATEIIRLANREKARGT